jgi:RNA polymerase sigma-70 factor, ECF subfamily
MHLSDDELVQAVLAGRKQQYSEIVTRYQQPVYNLMYRYARNEQDAADLTQEVFLRAFDRLSTYRNGCSLFSWLYTLAVNRANDWSRSRTRRMERLQTYIQEERLHGEANRATDGLESREEGRMLYRALDLLPPETREILLLRYRHDQPVRDVAAVFGMSESAVKMRVKRGLEQMQKLLLEMYGDETGNFEHGKT